MSRQHQDRRGQFHQVVEGEIMKGLRAILPLIVLVPGIVVVAFTYAAAGPSPVTPAPRESRVASPPAGAPSDWWTAVQTNIQDAEDAARVEADLAAGGDAQHAFEALSSLAYGYFVLARRAADSPSVDPLLKAHLERWNELLSRAYHETPPDGSLRVAVREAAEDL